MYILAALGFAFIFSMLGILNIAHGGIYMVGGYLAFFLITKLGIYPWAGLLLVGVILAGLGVLIERFCFRPFVGDFNKIIMVGVSITVIIKTIVNIMLGTKTLTVTPLIKGVIGIDSFSVSSERILTLIIGGILLGIIAWFVNRARWGKQMQAIAQNIDGARLQGINVNSISAIACALGLGLAAIAGCLMGMLLSLSSSMGDLMLIKVLIVVILAGVGSVSGIFITGLVLGAMDAVFPVITNGIVGNAIAVAIVIIILLIKPRGFFGREV